MPFRKRSREAQRKIKRSLRSDGHSTKRCSRTTPKEKPQCAGYYQQLTGALQ